MSYEEQIMFKDKYPSMFSPQMEAIVFIIFQIFFATCAVLKNGKYYRIFPTLGWGILGQVKCLHQSHASENIWWSLINNYSPKQRWLAMDIYRATKWRGKYWTLATHTEVNSCFSILKQWDNIHHKKLIWMTSSLITAAKRDAIFSLELLGGK